MKYLFTLTVFLFSVLSFRYASAQSFASLSSKHDVAYISLGSSAYSLQNATNKVKNYERRWKSLKTSGIILTGVGVGFITGGIALISNAVNDPMYGSLYSDGTDLDAQVAIGTLGIAGGILATGGGITMWAIGGNRLKKIRNRVSFNATPRSAHLAIKF